MKIVTANTGWEHPTSGREYAPNLANTSGPTYVYTFRDGSRVGVRADNPFNRGNLPLWLAWDATLETRLYPSRGRHRNEKSYLGSIFDTVADDGVIYQEPQFVAELYHSEARP